MMVHDFKGILGRSLTNTVNKQDEQKGVDCDVFDVGASHNVLRFATDDYSYLVS